LLTKKLEVKEKENFEELLTTALNEAILQVNKCTQQELQDLILNIEE
jgi:DNA-binding protein YbaB